MDVIRVTYRNAFIAQQAAEAARQPFIASVVGGITTAANFVTSTIGSSAIFLSGYSVGMLSQFAGQGLKAYSNVSTIQNVPTIFLDKTNTIVGWHNVIEFKGPYKILVKGATALTVTVGSAKIVSPYFNPRLTLAQQRTLSFIKLAKVEISLGVGGIVGIAAAPLTPFGQFAVGSAGALTTDAILTKIEKWLEYSLKLSQ